MADDSSLTGCPRNLSPRDPSNEHADQQAHPREIGQTTDADPAAVVEPRDLPKCSTTLMEAAEQVTAVVLHDVRIQGSCLHDAFEGA